MAVLSEAYLLLLINSLIYITPNDDVISAVVTLA
jgi:hypothetical protein